MANPVYISLEWMVARGRVLERDRRRCRRCGKGDRGLEVDHIVPLSAGGAPFELSNLRTLCRACHRSRHGGGGVVV